MSSDKNINFVIRSCDNYGLYYLKISPVFLETGRLMYQFERYITADM